MKKYTIGEYERVTKKTAEKLYNSDATVFVCPCKVNPSGVLGAIPVYNDKTNNFTSVCNEIKFYNCNHETGDYLAYYKKIN